MKNCYTWQSLCQHSGVQLLQWLGVQQPNVLKDMNFFCKSFYLYCNSNYSVNGCFEIGIKHRGKRKVKSLEMTLESFVQEKLIPTLRQNLLALTLKTWMKMNWKCCQKLVQGWQTRRCVIVLVCIFTWKLIIS